MLFCLVFYGVYLTLSVPYPTPSLLVVIVVAAYPRRQSEGKQAVVYSLSCFVLFLLSCFVLFLLSFCCRLLLVFFQIWSWERRDAGRACGDMDSIFIALLLLSAFCLWGASFGLVMGVRLV